MPKPKRRKTRVRPVALVSPAALDGVRPTTIVNSITLDGGQAGATDLAEALEELRRLGGDDRAVVRAIFHGDIAEGAALLHGEIWQDAARLRHERDAPDPASGRELERTRRLLSDLADLGTTASHPAIRTAATNALIELNAGGHQADVERNGFPDPDRRADGEAVCDPLGLTTVGLKRRRVAAARNPHHRHFHEQIPPGARAPDGEPDPVASYFIPRVVRAVFPHVAATRPTIEREIRRQHPKAIPERVDNLTRESVNDLAARIVRALCPVWSAGLRPRQKKGQASDGRSRALTGRDVSRYIQTPR